MTNLEALLCCPQCKTDLKRLESKLKCAICNSSFSVKDDIYFFLNNDHAKGSTVFKDFWETELNNLTVETKISLSQNYDNKYIKELAAPLKNRVLLDAGCGTGLSTVKLLKEETQIIFIDIIPEALYYIKKFIEMKKIEGNFLFVVADLTKLPIKDYNIDIIWSGGVLEHFENLKIPFLELYRVLKRGGDMIFTIPNKFGIQRILSAIKERFSRSKEDHFEKGFVYYQLKRLFSKKVFSDFHIRAIGIEQTYYELLIPALKIELPQAAFISYNFIIKFLTKLIPSIKLGASWFLLNGKKK